MAAPVVFALKHRVPRGVLRQIGTERHVRPGEVEDLDERIVAEAILEHPRLCSWEVAKRGDHVGSTVSSVPPLKG